MQRGWIYAVREEGTPLIKIGYSSAVASRVADLRTQLRVPLTLVAAIHVEQDVSRIERTIHSSLASARIQGEWFYLHISQDRLAALVEQARTTLVRTDRERAGRCLRRNIQLGMHQPLRALTFAHRKALGVSLDYLAGRKDEENVVLPATVA